MSWIDYRLKGGPAKCKYNTSRSTGTVRGTARGPHSPHLISVSVQQRMRVMFPYIYKLK